MKFVLTISIDDAVLDEQLKKEGMSREEFKQALSQSFTEDLNSEALPGATITVEAHE